MMKMDIVLILIIISLLISGCINGNNDKEILGGQGELDLIIDIENSLYSNTTVYFNITIQLVNTYYEKVVVEKRFDLGSNIKVYIITPSDNLLTVHVPSSTHSIEKTYLEPNEKKQFQFNLNDYKLVYDENKTTYNFEAKGDYQIYAEYKSLSGDVLISERKSFTYQ